VGSRNVGATNFQVIGKELPQTDPDKKKKSRRDETAAVNKERKTKFRLGVKPLKIGKTQPRQSGKGALERGGMGKKRRGSGLQIIRLSFLSRPLGGRKKKTEEC